MAKPPGKDFSALTLAQGCFSKVSHAPGFTGLFMDECVATLTGYRLSCPTCVQFYDLFGNAGIGVLWLDMEGRVLKANQTLLELLGGADAWCPGRKLQDFAPDAELTEAFLRRLFQGGQLRDFHLQLKQSDGSMRHALADGKVFVEAARPAGALLLLRDITPRVDLMTELLQVSEREKQRLGIELHDSLGQHLHATYYYASLLRDNLSRSSLAQAREAAELSGLLEEALELARGLSRGLQPIQPSPEGLRVALRELALRCRALYRVDCRLYCRRRISAIYPGVATHLYRIAQEAVNNALKHARPTRIRMALLASARGIALKIRDNGRGMDRPNSDLPGMGLQNMRYRATAIGGQLQVNPAPQGGTEVVCSVPTKAPLSQPQTDCDRPEG